MGRVNFEGGGAAHCKAYGHSVVSCAKTAEPTEMLFGLWTQMGQRSHVIEGAQDPPTEGAILRGKIGPL